MLDTPEFEGAGLLESHTELGVLAVLRHSIRRFLVVGDQNAQRQGLTAQQYQALLGIKAGYPGRETISIGELADHLQIKHHSAVELTGRLETAKLVTRKQDAKDRRLVMLSVTPVGERMLEELSRDNLQELRLAIPVFSSLIALLDREWMPRRQRDALAKMREMGEGIASALAALGEAHKHTLQSNVVKFISSDHHAEALAAAGAPGQVLHQESKPSARAEGPSQAAAPALAAFSKAFSGW